MSQVWVIGQGGLLGSALLRLLRQEGQIPFAVDEPWQWSSSAQLGDQMQGQTRRFARQLTAGESWTIYWAAGQGNLHSREEDFNAENTAFNTLLSTINAEPALLAAEGRIALASSAGAVYSGCLDQPITERSGDSPTTPYGRAKLGNEAALIAWARNQAPLRHSGRHAFIGRLSTLYGPGQAWGKQQGLISHLARQLLRNKPLHIYVPLGTQRDYLHVDDAAWAMVEGVRQMCTCVAHHIIASEQATTVAEILGSFARLMRRSPRIVTSAAAAGSVYRQQMTFRSEQPIRPSRGHGLTPLHIGIHQVLQAELSALANGNRPKVDASP
ncbi:MAG: NAD-dependent epimerase/dehydratase family protein [Burkholderiaceae bacterium]